MTTVPLKTGQLAFVKYWQKMLRRRGIKFVVGKDWSPDMLQDYIWVKRWDSGNRQDLADRLHEEACCSVGIPVTEQEVSVFAATVTARPAVV